MRAISFTKHVLSQVNTKFKDLKISNPTILIREISLNVMYKFCPHYTLEVESWKKQTFLFDNAFLARRFHSGLF